MIPDFVLSVLAPGNWATFVFVSTRLGGMMLAAPLWSMSVLPAMVRAGIVVLLATLLLPFTPKTPMPAQVLDLPVVLALEFVLGVVIGLAAAVLVQGVTMAGEVVSIQMGLALGPALAPMPDLAVAGVAQLKSLLALAIYVCVGGHLVLLRGVAESFQALPPGVPLSLQSGERTAVTLLGTLYSTAVRTAAPIMVALLLSNVAMAILNRAVPHVNTMLIALPASTLIGLLMLGAALPFLAGAIGGWMESIPSMIVRLTEGFRPAPVGP